MDRELAVFRSNTDDADLTVEEGQVLLPERLLAYPWDDVHYSFGKSTFVLETPSGRIQIGDRLLRAESTVSADVLLDQWVADLMRQHIIARGTTFIHASAVSKDGAGFLFPAWSHTGKTNVALGFLKKGYSYLSDDYCFVSSSGEIAGFPRWLSIFDYNLKCHPFLQKTLSGFEETRNLKRRLAATEFAQGLSLSNSMSRRLREWLSSRYGVHMRVPASVAVPQCQVALRARLSKVCMFAATRSREYTLRELSPRELASKVVSNTLFERGQFLRHRLAIAFSGLWDLEDSSAAEVEVLTRAFRAAKCAELTLPWKPSSRDIDHVRDLVEAL